MFACDMIYVRVCSGLCLMKLCRNKKFINVFTLAYLSAILLYFLIAEHFQIRISKRIVFICDMCRIAFWIKSPFENRLIIQV